MSCRAALALLSAVLLLVLFPLVAAQSPPATMADVRITSITGCVDVYPVTVNCSVARNTLRIQTAAGLPAANSRYGYAYFYITAQLNNFSYFTTTSVWPDPSDPTNTSVFVNVTARAYMPLITGSLISVYFVDYNVYPYQTSPAFAGFSYRFEGPPTLTAIAGCEGSGQATLNCVPDTAIIALTGSGLLWYSSGTSALLSIGNETSRTLSMAVVNDSYATLPLTWIYASLLKPQHYAGVLLSINLTSYVYSSAGDVVYTYTTNSLHISFVPLPPPKITQWYVLCA